MYSSIGSTSSSLNSVGVNDYISSSSSSSNYLAFHHSLPIAPGNEYAYTSTLSQTSVKSFWGEAFAQPHFKELDLIKWTWVL